MSEKKMTKREHFIVLRGVAEDAGLAEQVAFVDHELELLDKKHSSKSVDVKREAAKAAVKDAITSALADGGEHKASAIAATTGESVQRITAMLTQMRADGTVVRRQEKKDTFFSLAV